MALVARGGQLLVGADGLLTTNDECCCEPPCENLLGCNCWGPTSIEAVANATLSISGPLVADTGTGGIPSGCLPVTFDDQSIDIDVEMACDSGRNFRIYGETLCTASGFNYCLIANLICGHSVGSVGVLISSGSGSWSTGTSTPPAPGVVYEFGVDPEFSVLASSASGFSVSYGCAATPRLCPPFTSFYCRPLGAASSSLNSDTPGNARWIVNTGITISAVR